MDFEISYAETGREGPLTKIYVDKRYTVRIKFCDNNWSAEIVVYYLWYHPVLWKQKTIICLGLCL